MARRQAQTFELTGVVGGPWQATGAAMSSMACAEQHVGTCHVGTCKSSASSGGASLGMCAGTRLSPLWKHASLLLHMVVLPCLPSPVPHARCICGACGGYSVADVFAWLNAVLRPLCPLPSRPQAKTNPTVDGKLCWIRSALLLTASKSHSTYQFPMSSEALHGYAIGRTGCHISTLTGGCRALSVTDQNTITPRATT